MALNIAVGHGANVSSVIAVAGSAGGKAAYAPQALPVLAILSNWTTPVSPREAAELRAAAMDPTLLAICSYVRVSRNI